jgi:hypothetical protein
MFVEVAIRSSGRKHLTDNILSPTPIRATDAEGRLKNATRRVGRCVGHNSGWRRLVITRRMI